MKAGETVGDYTPIRIVGRGSRGIVWEARRESTGESVALKTLDTRDPAAAERLRAEFASQSRIRHPNVVAVHELVQIDAQPALVAELVDGCDLRAYIDDFHPDPARARRVFAGILRGLGAAHEAGLVHRDLKPTNILMTPGAHSIPKIIDFGIVKTAHGMDLTHSGMVLGTLRYMAPEQLRDPSGVDVRADLFSAGCIYFELLTHSRCFDAPNKVALMNAVRNGQHTPFPDDLDADTRALLASLIAPEPGDRPESARAVLEQLGADASDSDLSVPLAHDADDLPDRPWALIFGLGGALGLIAALAVIYLLFG